MDCRCQPRTECHQLCCSSATFACAMAIARQTLRWRWNAVNREIHSTSFTSNYYSCISQLPLATRPMNMSEINYLLKRNRNDKSKNEVSSSVVAVAEHRYSFQIWNCYCCVTTNETCNNNGNNKLISQFHWHNICNWMAANCNHFMAK